MEAENDPKRIDRLRLGPGETLRLGAGYDPEATFVLPPPKKRQVGDAEPRPNRGPHRETHRWGTCLVHAPTVLALAAGTPFEACCKLAEGKLPERLREPEPSEAGEAPAAAKPPAEATAQDVPQNEIDAMMHEHLKNNVTYREGRKPKFLNEAIAIREVYDVLKNRGATWEQVKQAYQKAPASPSADAVRQGRRNSAKQRSASSK